jgi:hypothetical protein
MKIEFVGLPSETVAQIRHSGRDAYDLPIERHHSDGNAYPCRHCLGETPLGQDYLILAHRPFVGLNPYAETGPIFLCASNCQAAALSEDVPPILVAAQYLLRGYTTHERILYGTGKVVATSEMRNYARALFARPEVAFVDVRSASNNCFQCRIHPAS